MDYFVILLDWASFWVRWDNLWGVIGWGLFFLVWAIILIAYLIMFYQALKARTVKESLKFIFLNPLVKIVAVIVSICFVISSITQFFDKRAEKKERIQELKDSITYLASTKGLRKLEQTGNAYFLRKKYDSAIYYLNKSDTDGFKFETQLTIGISELRLDSFNKAERIFKELQQDSILDDSTFKYLALLKLNTRLYRTSIRYAQKGLRLKDEPYLHFYLAMDHLNLALKTSLRAHPDNAEFDSAAVEITKANRFLPLNQYREAAQLIGFYRVSKPAARHEIDSILKAAPSFWMNYQCIMALATFSAQELHYREGIHYLTLAIALDSAKGYDYFFRAALFLQTKQTDLACLDFRKASQLGYVSAKDSLLKYGLRTFKHVNE